MRTAEQWVKEEMGLTFPKDIISGVWFQNHNLPMIVHCSCCGSTMSLPSAMIDDDGYIYCSTCADG